MAATPQLYTDDQVAVLVELSWDAGRMYEAQRIGDAVADLDAAWYAHGLATREQRIAARADAMQPADPDWLAKSAARLRDHDDRQLDIGLRHPPIRDWAAVHARVSDLVWLRIWHDLAPATRDQLGDLAPIPAQLG